MTRNLDKAMRDINIIGIACSIATLATIGFTFAMSANRSTNAQQTEALTHITKDQSRLTVPRAMPEFPRPNRIYLCPRWAQPIPQPRPTLRP